MTMTIDHGPKMLSDLTLAAVRAESLRAHLKHGDRSLLCDGLTTLQRLAALVEEVGEVAIELSKLPEVESYYGYQPPAGIKVDQRLSDLVVDVADLGESARIATYDIGGRPLCETSDDAAFDVDLLVKELIQVASVALSWAEWLDTSEKTDK